MKIRMLRTERGSVDGILIVLYEAEQEYDLGGTDGARDLATAFVGAGLAEPADATPDQSLAHEPEIAETVDEAPVLAPARKAPRAKK